MIEPAVAFSTRRARRILLAALVVALLGVAGWRGLRRDAIPDLSSPQIVLVGDWMGHSATDVASQVTNVLARALADVPGVEDVRGTSMAGMAYVDVVFKQRADLAPGRAAIVERVARARAALPANLRLQIGPLASSTGWVFEYALIDPRRKHSALQMRAFQDGVLRPMLSSIAGVVEVASVGPGAQQLLVEVAPASLRQRRVAFSDVVAAVRVALATGHVHAPADVAALVVGAEGQRAVRLEDVGRARIADDMPSGLADVGGIQPAIGGIVIAGFDADIPRVIESAHRALEAARARLPEGIELVTVYDRSEVIVRTSATLVRALCEEIGVVVLVLFVFLLHGRSAVVPLLTLPVVVLATMAAMWLLRIPATIMTLGGVGIALGMAVDADVVALEACHRRLEGRGPTSDEDRRAQLVSAAAAFAPAILTALVIAALTFLPVLAFTGETGRLLRPLALTKTILIGAAALASFTLSPALRAWLVRGRVRRELDNPLTARLVRMYRPFVQLALERPGLTLVTAALAVASCLPIVPRLRGEFLPPVDEGDLLFMPTTSAGVRATDTALQLSRQGRALADSPEVATVFGKVGRADTATDPAPWTMIETTVRLRPGGEWPRRRSELIERLDRAARLPGWVGAWTAPARARMDMMATGVRTPVGARIVAAEARLSDLGEQVRSILAPLPGTRGVVYESLGGEPRLSFTADAAAVARHGVDRALLSDTAALIIDGGQVGELDLEGRLLRARIVPDLHMSSMMPGGMPEAAHGPADQLREATVRARRAVVPLALLGRVGYQLEPSVIRTERGEAVAYLHVDLREDADVGGFVARARREIDRRVSRGELRLLPGERIEWIGEYELLAAGQRRLRWIAALVLASMLALLIVQFRSLTEAALVLVSVPFALVGSVWTLYALDYAMSAPVWVGMLSVVGLAMQTGVVMVVYIDEAFYRRVEAGQLRTRADIVAAHAEGTVQRLRPKIMTIATMGAGLLPLLWAHGAGSEIMRRVAAPMIGGLLTSALLTLEVLPVLYTMWRARQLARSMRTGRDLREIVSRTRPRASAAPSRD